MADRKFPKQDVKDWSKSVHAPEAAGTFFQ